MSSFWRSWLIDTTEQKKKGIGTQSPTLRDPWNKVSYGLLITVGRLVVWSRGLSAKCNFSDFSAGILGRLNCCSKGSFLSFVCVYAQIWSVPVQFVLNEQYTLYAHLYACSNENICYASTDQLPQVFSIFSDLSCLLFYSLAFTSVPARSQQRMQPH